MSFRRIYEIPYSIQKATDEFCGQNRLELLTQASVIFNSNFTKKIKHCLQIFCFFVIFVVL